MLSCRHSPAGEQREASKAAHRCDVGYSKITRVTQESKNRQLGAAVKCRMVGPLFLWALRLHTTKDGSRVFRASG